MKRKVLILSLFTIFILSSCGKKMQVNTTQTDIENTKQSIPGTTDTFYTDKDNSVELDLNGDNTKEKIVFYTQSNGSKNEEVLSINGKDYSEKVSITDPDNGFKTINKDENSYDIVIENKQDNYMQILEYDKDGNVASLGMMDGTFDENSETPTTINDDGSLSGYAKIESLETCYIPINYVLNDGRYYQYFNYDNAYPLKTKREGKITAKQDFTVHEQMYGTELLTLPAGTQFDSTKTNGCEWANVVLDDGTEYWLAVQNRTLIDDEKSTLDAFTNLYLENYN